MVKVATSKKPRPIMASSIKSREQFEKAMREGRPIIFEKGIGPEPTGRAKGRGKGAKKG